LLLICLENPIHLDSRPSVGGYSMYLTPEKKCQLSPVPFWKDDATCFPSGNSNVWQCPTIPGQSKRLNILGSTRLMATHKSQLAIQFRHRKALTRVIDLDFFSFVFAGRGYINRHQIYSGSYVSDDFPGVLKLRLLVWKYYTPCNVHCNAGIDNAPKRI
jgi:hypothetical protein